jgi:hypothetical protein
VQSGPLLIFEAIACNHGLVEDLELITGLGTWNSWYGKVLR